MSDRPADLSSVQHWMQAVIMHPGGVSAGLASGVARAAIDVAPIDVEQVVAHSATLSGVERLGIYANAYYARLVECLSAEFPILAAALGQEAFAGFAFEYLQRYPSRSYTLARLGENFARHLEETRPPRKSHVPDWADFLIDLARLEWTFSQVFDGPGVEGRELLSAERLRSIPVDRWPETSLVCVPCLKLVAFRFPVSGYFTAVRQGRKPPPPAPDDSFLAVTRRHFVVRRHELTKSQFELLLALQAGATVGAAIERAAPAEDAAFAAFAAKLQDWFADWSAEGFFQGVSLFDQRPAAG